jgi:hypothetical protein
VPDLSNPVHAYVPAAPGCWSAFTGLQAEELHRWGRSPAHGTIVDAYMAQHPGDGNGDVRARRSPIIHLIGLCGRLEHDLTDDVAGPLLQRTAHQLRHEVVPALGRRTEAGTVTVVDLVTALHEGIEADGYDARARAWAEDVWRTWTHEHSRIRDLYRQAWPQ